MLQGTVRAHRDQNVLSHTWCCQWSPSIDELMISSIVLPDLSNGHGLIHVIIQDVAGLSGECVENTDCTVTVSSSDVLVIGVETDTESLLLGVTQGVLVRHLNVRVLYHLQTKG